MSVTIVPVGHLKCYVQGQKSLILEQREGYSLSEVCRELGLPLNLIALYVVNGRPQSKEYLLQSDDEVKLVSIVGGG